jgi:hypothetical protein
VLDHHKGHAGMIGHGVEKLLQRLQTTGGGPDADDVEFSIACVFMCVWHDQETWVCVNPSIVQ